MPMADYAFYEDVYLGAAIPEKAFPGMAQRARETLQRFQRIYRVSIPGEDSLKMAICAMAEAIAYFDAAQNGEGGLRYAKVGSVSVSGKGIYSQVDISAAAQEKELYRTASRYLDIYRGCM